MWSTEGIQAALAGSPYSLPDDEVGLQRVLSVLPRLRELEERAHAVRTSLATASARLVRENQQVREIFESNAIEYLGPSLAGTASILRSRHAVDVRHAVNRYTLLRNFAGDKRLQEVMGLYGARATAVDIMTSVRRDSCPITESDLRGMHRLILGDVAEAGRYKVFDNEISGSSHKPHPAADVPHAMGELVRWLNREARSAALPDVLKAAVAHAWFVHIHPFADGNGRMARLVANMLLGSAAMPPVIIRHDRDRSAYLNALEHSDAAGDIVKLLGLFIRVLNRELGDLESPDGAIKLFDLDLRKDPEDEHAEWRSAVRAFAIGLGGELVRHGLRLHVVADPSREDLRHLYRTDFRMPWGVITDVRRPARGRELREVQVWMRDSKQVRRGLAESVNDPAFVFSVALDGAVHFDVEDGEPVYTYLPNGFWRLGMDQIGFRELVVRAAPQRDVCVERYEVVRMSISDAASYIAERIGSAARSGRLWGTSDRRGLRYL